MTPTDKAAALHDHLAAARWFGGKGRTFEVGAVTELGWLTPPDSWPAARIEIAEVGYPDAGSQAPVEFYQLLVGYRPADQVVPDGSVGPELFRVDDPEHGLLVASDGVLDPTVRRVLLIRLLGEFATTDEAGSVVFRLRRGQELPAELTPELSGSVFGGQQSNTSVMYGDVAMLKLFRRLELGRNLDIEAHQVLSDAAVTDVARLYGWLEGSWRSSAGTRHTADLGMVVEKLGGATDGWELALDRLGAGHSFDQESRELGRALREIHAALRSSFATDLLPGDDLADEMAARLSRAVGAAPQLADHVPGLRACFDELRGRDLEAQRVHGDFHLGQTLHTPDGWKIIDFEGEPAKSMAERIAPDSPWRDLAGLLRSFDYAAASVPDDAGRPRGFARDWAQRCAQAALDGYAGGALDPDASRLLRAYTADKAVYEVVYEARNRPDWVHIPLAAVAALAATAGSASTESTEE